MAELRMPTLSLVVLVGASGAGKSTFARQHFLPTEVVSSDFCRGLVADNENDQSATKDAFEVLHFIAAKRLASGRLTVIDATNVQPSARKPLVEIARQYHVIPVAIVFDLPESLSHERNRSRPERDFGRQVVHRQLEELRRSLRSLQKEGFRHVHVLRSPEEVEAVSVVREPLYSHKHADHGPFDIIGDVHGCLDELVLLLERLDYVVHEDDRAPFGVAVAPPNGRKAIFLGDLADRGPNVPQVLRLVMSMVGTGAALCVPGNHEMKLLRALSGRNVQMSHGLPESLAQLANEPLDFVEQVKSFIDSLTSHFVLDDGKLVVAHAGLKQEMHGRGSRRVRDFALYGETTGETDDYGLPVRYPWAQDYRGQAMVVYGHTPVPEPQWLNSTICVDTGCVFGGHLTALRYPEKQLVSVPAGRVYYEPIRPLAPPAPLPFEDGPALTPQQEHDDLLDLADVIGRRAIATRLIGNVIVPEEEAAAALEVMSRFAADPRWLVYLPPTMAPAETSHEPGLLEYPTEAFASFRHEGVLRVVCEEKHMGSRAVVVVCRNAATATHRFGVTGDEASSGGIVYTRTGRRFFEDRTLEAALLDRVRRALATSGLWEELNTDWVVLDCELLPWSAKAQELLRQQYAAVGAAATTALPASVEVLEQAAARGLDVADLLAREHQRAGLTARYIEAYGRYCWTVHGLDDLKVAPFHVLASEGAVHDTKNHVWHMETVARACRVEKVLLETPFVTVDLADPASEIAAVSWWRDLVARGGEGMVVKPLDFVTRNLKRRLVQPALKCRGPEYLRLIYGPEYTMPEHLARLRARGTGAKRSLATREFALGIEGLQRFVEHEPLRRVHECAFGVLALESEPVDPRL